MAQFFLLLKVGFSKQIWHHSKRGGVGLSITLFRSFSELFNNRAKEENQGAEEFSDGWFLLKSKIHDFPCSHFTDFSRCGILSGLSLPTCSLLSAPNKLCSLLRHPPHPSLSNLYFSTKYKTKTCWTQLKVQWYDASADIERNNNVSRSIIIGPSFSCPGLLS